MDGGEDVCRAGQFRNEHIEETERGGAVACRTGGKPRSWAGLTVEDRCNGDGQACGGGFQRNRKRNSCADKSLAYEPPAFLGGRATP